MTHDHEDGANRVFLHAQDHQIVLIKSPDTDVVMITSSLQRDSQFDLYFYTSSIIWKSK